jgi:hypothetical protein
MRALMINMNKTINKLSEAEFFISKMKEEYDQHEYFEYYLSAFVSACRSVLWILSAEYSKDEDWQAWYKSKTPDEEEKKFLKDITEVRNRSQKHTPLKAGLMETMALDREAMPNEVYDFFLSGNSDQLDIELHDSSSVLINGKYVVPMVANKLYKEVDEFKGQDILDVSKRYLGMISKVVAESRIYLEQRNH